MQAQGKAEPDGLAASTPHLKGAGIPGKYPALMNDENCGPNQVAAALSTPSWTTTSSPGTGSPCSSVTAVSTTAVKAAGTPRTGHGYATPIGRASSKKPRRSLLSSLKKPRKLAYSTADASGVEEESATSASTPLRAQRRPIKGRELRIGYLNQVLRSEKLEEVLEEQTDRLNSATSRAERLRTALDESRAREDALAAELDKTQRVLHRLQAASAEVAAENKATSMKLQDANDLITALKKEREHQSECLSEAHSEIEALRSERSALYRKVNALLDGPPVASATPSVGPTTPAATQDGPLQQCSGIKRKLHHGSAGLSSGAPSGTTSAAAAVAVTAMSASARVPRPSPAKQRRIERANTAPRSLTSGDSATSSTGTGGFLRRITRSLGRGNLLGSSGAVADKASSLGVDAVAHEDLIDCDYEAVVFTPPSKRRTAVSRSTFFHPS